VLSRVVLVAIDCFPTLTQMLILWPIQS